MTGCLKLVFCLSFLLVIEAKFPGDGKAFGESGPFLELDQTSDINTKTFFEDYVKTKKPLFIKNGSKMFPAVKLWTDEYLSQQAKDFDHLKMVVETTKKESREQEILSLSLNEFLKEYKSKDIYLVNDVPEYLKRDVGIPQPLQCEQAVETIDQTVISLFLSQKKPNSLKRN